MVEMFEENLHSFENFTKYEKWIHTITNKMYFEENSIKNIKENVLTDESWVFYREVL